MEFTSPVYFSVIPLKFQLSLLQPLGKLFAYAVEQRRKKRHFVAVT